MSRYVEWVYSCFVWMIRGLIIGIIACQFVFFLGHDVHAMGETPHEKVAPSVSSSTITILVKGMVCSFCAQGIAESFKGMDSIQQVNIDMDDETVMIILKRNAQLADDIIRRIINDSGYEVSSILRSSL